MCSLDTSNIVQRVVNQNYVSKKRSSSYKWSIINAGLFLVFAYDLSCKNQDYVGILHYVEFTLMTIFGVNLLHHAWYLLSSRDIIEVTTVQQRLLGMSSDIDSSFRIVEKIVDKSNEDYSADSENQSMSSARSWRSRGSSPPPSTRTRHRFSPKSLSPDESVPPSRIVPDEFIADQSSLTEYLKVYEGHRLQQKSPNANESGAWNSSPPPQYQLASTELDSGAMDDQSPQVWWRLHLDPLRLTQFNLNLRLWISQTILERLVREIGVIEENLAKHGLSDVRIGQVSIERLRQTATSAVAGTLPALLGFLDPFPDQRYVVQRIKELSQGGCLSNYKWNGGGSDWEESKPTDSELLMSLIASYLDGQLPGGGGGPGRPFSERYVCAAPARAHRKPDTLLIHRVTRVPPHYVLIMGEETLEVTRGRNNLLHTVLLFIAALVRPAAGPAPQGPPVLNRVHLGPAGLNMLWIIGL